eukprot:Skav213837  [mRNA]  locus=scaffold315:167189:167548:+ [translate_table: standard]
MTSGCIKIAGTYYTFAALKDDGTVVQWGTLLTHSSHVGTEFADVEASVTDAVDIFVTDTAYAALNSDGSIITWGNGHYGGDTTYPSDISADLSPLDLSGTPRSLQNILMVPVLVGWLVG